VTNSAVNDVLAKLVVVLFPFLLAVAGYGVRKLIETLLQLTRAIDRLETAVAVLVTRVEHLEQQTKSKP
jgi:cell division protein FtsB